MDEVRARHVALGPPTTPQETLRRLVELDEMGRQYLWLADDSALPEAERLLASRAIGERLSSLDARNTRDLMRLIPKTGWFRLSRDGEQVAHGAWLIVQHSPSNALREQVLRAMTPLLKLGEADPHDYALLYDRVDVQSGRPQFFGTQATCAVRQDARKELAPIDGPSQVDRRRREIGWGVTLAETKGDLQIGGPC
jgi:hypothetical protein